jgi:hypothetical protein
MSIRVQVFILGFVLVSSSAGSCYSQQKADPNDAPLGNVAREVKAQKAKQPKPVMVITNDNIHGIDENSGFGSSSPAKSSTAAPAEESATPGHAHDKEYFRSHLSTLQGQLDTHKREIDVLQQKLGQNQMQYYADPNKSLLQQYSREDINKFTADIDAKRQQIADDEKAIEDLRDQLRREGGDPGWLR